VSKILSDSGTWALYGNPNSQILVSGHSHAASVLDATLRDDLEGTNPASLGICYTSDLSKGAPGGGIYWGDKTYWQFVSEVSKGKDLVIVWNGNQHVANFLFQTIPPFTIHGALDSDSATGYLPIPRTMIKAFFEPFFEELTEIIPLMKDAASITLMNGPAPKPLSYIKSRVKHEPFFADIANSLQVDIDSLEITSDQIRLELWKLISEMLETHAKTLGTRFLSAPEKAVDSSGMLLEKYWNPDVSHANAEYGALLVEKLHDFFAVRSN
jgi:hypothetical protein